MATFFKTSVLWVVAYRYDGRPRVWYRAVPEGTDPEPDLKRELAALYGDRARLETVRLATADEETAYCRGELAPNRMCPVRP